MLFKDYHIPMIRSGSKTQTRREWADGYSGPNVGSVVMAAASCMVPDDAEHNSPMLLSSEDCTCFIRICDHWQEPLGDITDADARAEGDYSDVREFRRGYEKVYGEGSWDAEKVVDVVEFKYVGKERSPWDE